LRDPDAAAHNMLRVIDEDKSEPNGYLHEAPMFARIELPDALREVLEKHGQLYTRRPECGRTP
jgi:hypothetical protein